MNYKKIFGPLLALMLTLAFTACGDDDNGGGGGGGGDDLLAFVFSANVGDGTVSGFAVDEDGEVSSIDGEPFEAGDEPLAIAATPNGNFLYVANWDSGTISVFEVDQNTGELTEVDVVDVRENEVSPLSLIVHPDGDFLYVGTDNCEFLGYDIDTETGELTENEAIDHGCGPDIVAMAWLDDENLILLDAEGIVFAIEVDPETHEWNFNDWADISQWIEEDGVFGANIAIDPENGWIYITFVVNPECCDALAASTGTGSGNLVAPEGAGGIATLGLDVEGLFFVDSNLATFPIEADNPDGAVVSPDGQFLYVAVGGEDAIGVWEINGETGELEFFDAFDSGGVFPQALLMSADGSVLVVANLDDDTVSAFEVNDGELDFVDSFETGAGPIALTGVQ